MRFISRSSLLLAALAGLLGAASAQAPAVPAGRAVAEAPPVGAAVRALRDDLREIIRAPGWPSARYGVLVVSLDRGDTLFALDPDLPLAPASNLKLYTTAAALYYLGPRFRYSTYALGTGEIRDGVLQGDLVLYGTGDPSISRRMLGSDTGPLRNMADSLYARGVRAVQGDLVGDGSYFDADWIGDGWTDDDRLRWYGAPIGALDFAENMVTVRVLPGSAAGEPALLRTEPDTRGLDIANGVRTVAGGGTRVRIEQGEDGLVVTGRIDRRSPEVTRTLPVVDPADYAAAAFRAVLEERGIRVQGKVRSVRTASASPVGLATVTAAGATTTPPARVLAVHLSPTLANLAMVTNHVSHNLFADALLKTAGRVALGDGSFAGGARAVRYFLECEAGVDTASLHLFDGSGLSRFNRVTARTTLRLLDYMARSPEWEAYYASLPEAADPVGLQRMRGTAAAGNLRAKTGTISRVSSLSGYVRAADGERLAFSIIANDVPSVPRAKATEDAIGARLARFQRRE